MRRAPPKAQGGYALLIAIAIIAMGSIYTLVSQLEQHSRRFGREAATIKSLVLAREALLGYAATYRDTHANEVFGYLPCPDFDGDGQADPNVGGRCNSVDGEAEIGLLPYRTLGLPDLRDTDGVCLWYAVAGRYKAATNKATPMNWDTQGQFSVTDLNGSVMVAPDQGDGGAAVVIFAAGSPLAAPWGGGGSQLAARAVSGNNPCGIVPAAAQVAAHLDGNYNFASGATIALVDGVAGNASNNDRMLWVTPRELFDRLVKRKDFGNAASGRPPGQINVLIDELKAAYEKRIQDDLSGGGNTSSPDTASFAQANGERIGALATPLPALLDMNYTNTLANWAEQFHLVTCSPLSTTCLTLNGTQCRGALLFGSRAVNGKPRPGPQKIPSTDIAQTSACALSSSHYGSYANSANLCNYYEASGALPLLSGTASTFTGATAYATTSPAQDVGTCLFPGKFLSFQQDIAGFAAGAVASSSGANPVVSVATSGTPSITLGSSSLYSRSGCSWYSTPIPIGSSMRIYFTYQTANINAGDQGPGFVFALADAATNNVANTDPIMCGSTGSTRLGYAGVPTSGSAAGVKPPKIGLEFDTTRNTSRNDPSSNHFAFLLWGTSSDNNTNATNTGNDDNTHGFGTLGSGGEPLNPGTYSSSVAFPATATPIAHIASATWAGGTATVTTSAPHGYAANQYVYLGDVTGSGYNNTSATPYQIASVPASNQFTYALGSNPGTYNGGTTATATVRISGASWDSASKVATITTNQSHGFASGGYVSIADVTSGSSSRSADLGFNGTFQITVTGATTFTYSLSANPGGYSSGGRATPTNAIVSAIWSGVVVATNTAHGLTTGQQVTLSGISPNTYNGTYTVSVIDTTRFSFAATDDPGDYVAGGTLAGLGVTVANAAWGKPIVVTGNAHGLSSGQLVSLNGLAAAELAGQYAATVKSAAVFATSLAADPGTLTVGTDYGTAAPAGVAYVKSSDPYLPYASIPFATTIHVRMDIDRSYDATAKQAKLNMRAYIGDTFALAGNCTSAEFTNLARNLSSLCPLRTATVEQNGIAINDVATPSNLATAAWSANYITFTTATAHGLTSGQYVNVVGALPSEYNGAYQVVVFNSTQFKAWRATDPGAYISGGTVAAQAWSLVYTGFTTARGSSSTDNQSVTITNLILRSQ